MGVGGPSDPQLGEPIGVCCQRGCHFWCRPQCRHPSEVHQGSPWPHPPCMGSRRLTGAQAGTHAAARTHTHTSHQKHVAHSVSALGRVTGILTGLRELSTLPLPALGTYSSVYPSSCPGLASPAPGRPSSCRGTLRDEAFSILSWAMAGAPPTPPCAALAPLLPGLDPCRSRWGTLSSVRHPPVSLAWASKGRGSRTEKTCLLPSAVAHGKGASCVLESAPLPPSTVPAGVRGRRQRKRVLNGSLGPRRQVQEPSLGLHLFGMDLEGCCELSWGEGWHSPSLPSMDRLSLLASWKGLFTSRPWPWVPSVDAPGALTGPFYWLPDFPPGSLYLLLIPALGP